MSRQIAYVLLDAAKKFDPDAVITALRQRHPDVAIEPMVGSAPASPAAESMMLRCAGIPIVVMTMYLPLPEAEWKLPCLRASAAWPGAPAVFSGHQAHLVVATLSESTDRLLSARSIAAVVGGFISVLPGCRAVLWERLVAHSAESWEAASRDAFAPYPVFPYPLWASLHLLHDGGHLVVISFGLSSFVGREIELEAGKLSAEAAVKRAAGLAVYLMQHGPVLKDGDSFGTTDAEHIRIAHVQSKRVPGLAVLHATAEAARAGGS